MNKPLLLAGAAVAAAAVASASAHAESPTIEPVPEKARDYADANLRAFLKLIRDAESSDDYRALVGGGRFQSFATHPTFGEGFKGIPTKYRRKDGSVINSTAAGAYQIVSTTFIGLIRMGKFLGPETFSPENQDAMAIELIRQRGAYVAVRIGDIQSACIMLEDEWEFLKLPRYSPDRVVSMFESLGGFTA